MSSTVLTRALRNLGHTLAALTTNCPNFKQAWRTADEQSRSGGALEGRWEGEWVSQGNGHRGALRCVLVQLDNTRYRATFHARYARLLRVCYSVELSARPAGQGVALKGEADLGRLAGGVYTYEGQADGGQLQCSYGCRYDHGTFSLAKRRQSETTTALPAHPSGAADQSCSLQRFE